MGRKVYNKKKNSSYRKGDEYKHTEDVSSRKDAIGPENVNSGETSSDVSREGKDKTNDPEWYTKDNQLVIDAASLPFSEPLGDIINIEQGTTKGQYNGTTLGTVPSINSFAGILTMFTKASFGYNDSMKSPLNVASQMLYTNVRVKNSGRKNYDAPDLTIYVASMADIYSFIVWCERLYAKAFMYSQRNKFIGQALLESENIDANSIKNNLANFRYWLNAFINKVASYAVPASISYFARRVWIYSGLYLENPDANIKDQLYQFSPDGFYRFNLDDGKAGMLEYAKISEIIGHGNALSWTDIRTIGDWLFANVAGDEDFALMAGDIIKAFDGDIIKLMPMPEDAAIIPTYSEYVLLQFHNARLMGQALRGLNAPVVTNISGDTDTRHQAGNVYQAALDGILRSMECVDYNQTDVSAAMANADLCTKHLLDLRTPTPNPIDVMEATRLMPGFNGIRTANGGALYIGISCGSDLAVGISTTYYSTSTPGVLTIDFAPYSTAPLTTAGMINQTAIMVANRHIFKYMPVWKYGVFDSSGTFAAGLGTIDGNIHNYTLVDYSVIQKLHEVAMLSLLTVPGVAKFINSFGKVE